ncbi:MAG: thioredoxin domain-containing protein [Oscillospiraceae bacterium]|nr:thioredoxin domain-containing protein [Oscillospiraceae bacterium]
MNRLQYELSPCLIRWSEDSVDWYPWGKEAFAKAQEEHKPMLISIGNTADWAQLHCGRGTVARLTERYFVPVQVDGQEHPDVAAFYTQAACMMTGAPNRPLEVLTDPAGNPFFITEALREVELAGLLSGTALHWNSDASAYERIGSQMAEKLTRLETSVSEPAELPQLWETRFKQLQNRFDGENGGFGTEGKRLMPQDLLFLLRYARYTGERLPLKMAGFTLRQMALGAVRDQIGGGFFHGTTDARWEIPIPEKRLIDQAWMLEVYTRAYQMTGVELFRKVAAETADYVIRELRHTAGGFYTAQWSEDGHYLLTDIRVREALGDNDGSVFCRQYSVGENLTVPHLYNGEEPDEDSLLLHDLRMRLYRERLSRGKPLRDEKVLLGWNGIMIASLARAGRVLGVERYLTAASNAEEFLRSRMVAPLQLSRYWCHGAVSGDGTLEDYAGYALGLYELYRSGCGGDCLRNAAKIMARADALFSDWENGGYYLSRGQRDLPVRPKQPWDTDVPSPWAVALQVLVYLSKEIRHPGLQNRTKEQTEYACSVARSYDCSYALAAMMRNQ